VINVVPNARFGKVSAQLPPDYDYLAAEKNHDGKGKE
jgi:hypothetical protein